MDTTELLTTAGSAPLWTWPALAGGTAVLLVLLVSVRAVRRYTPAGTQTRTRRAETLLTVAVAGIATVASASGMWNFFGDTMHTTGGLRVALFAFIELALLVSALRDRRWRLRHKRIGVDGYAVWVLAVLTGLLAATDTDSVPAGLLRLAAPLVAAWLWERLLVGELDDQAEELRRQRREAAGTKPRRIQWRIRPDRVLVWLRLAEPTGREVAEVDRARRLAALARTAYRLHTLPEDARPRVRRRAATRLRRHVLACAEHVDLAADAQVRAALREHLATLYQAEVGTSPDAVRDLAPWRPVPVVDTADPVDPVPGWLDGSADDVWERFGTPVDDAPVSPAVPVPVSRPAVQAPRPVPVQAVPVSVQPDPAAPAPQDGTDTAPDRTDIPAPRIEVPRAVPANRPVSAPPRNTPDDELLPVVRPVVERLVDDLGRVPGAAKVRDALTELDPPVNVSPNRAQRLRDLALNSPVTVSPSAS